MKSIASTLLATLALCFVAGCASGNSSNSAGAGASSGSGVQVFGTIDAGVTHTTTKSGPAR